MSEQKLREALQYLYDETADYIRINNLGDIHQNRSMRMARDALAISHPTSDEGMPTETPLTDSVMELAENLKPGTVVVRVHHARQLERTLHAKERELADKDTVPRSRYNACNQDWLNAKAELTEIREIAKAEIERLRCLLDEAVDLLHHTKCRDEDATQCPACSLESRIDAAGG